MVNSVPVFNINSGLFSVSPPFAGHKSPLLLSEELGEPPKPCLPLYVITCGKGKKEKGNFFEAWGRD